MAIIDAICKHIMDSGFDCKPPGSFGPAFSGPCGGARLYVGSAATWLGTDRNSEHLVDILFYQDYLSLHFHQDSKYCCWACDGSGTINGGTCPRCLDVKTLGVEWLGGDHTVVDKLSHPTKSLWADHKILYADPAMFAKLYEILRFRAISHHKTKPDPVGWSATLCLRTSLTHC